MTGIGSTPSQRSVKRISAKGFIMLRTQYLEAPDVDENGIKLFQPHPECHWIEDDRIEIINHSSMKVMELGDVSKNPNAKSKVKDTAPPLEECKPLEVNEETRWKSKTMKSSLSSANLAQTESDVVDSPEAAAVKALLILNKISWTTMDRVTAKLVEQTNLVENAEIRKEIISILIGKAQTEQHFGPMYAQLCSIISKEFKPFKKELLHQCQGEFETDTAEKIAMATKTDDGTSMEPEEMEYHSMLIRKAYVGHIKFLGELYLRDVVKLSVMTYCLDELLKDETNEENLECFAHLMSTMGEKLVEHSKKKNNKPFDWDAVTKLQNSSKISNRIKFLLQDLLELKDRGKELTMLLACLSLFLIDFSLLHRQ
jgi:translation initiation factor 4G